MVLDLIERIFDALFARLSWSFPQGAGNGRVVTLIFAYAGGLLLVVGLTVLARLLWRMRAKRKHDLSDIFAELAAQNYTVADLIRISDEAPEQRSAVRYRYIAVLLALDEAGIIRITPSATNALIQRGLNKTHPPLAKDFAQMAQVYHIVWYGYRRVNADDMAAFNDVCKTLTEARHVQA
jgi:hypothetical protein